MSEVVHWMCSMAGRGRFAIAWGLWLWLWLVGSVYLHSGGVVVMAQESGCPLDFSVLNKFPAVAQQARLKNVQCLTLLDGLEMVMAEYLRNTSYFLLPPAVVPACLDSYQAQLRSQGTDANVTELCEDDLPSSMARGADNCQGIQTSHDLAAIASRYSSLKSAQQSCAGVLADADYHQNVECAACIKQLASLTADLQSSNAFGVQRGCQNYSSMYVAAVINIGGPLEPHTAACLFSIFPVSKGKKNLTGVYVAVGAIAIALLGFAVGLSFYYKHRRRKLAEEKAFIKRNTDLLEGSMRSGDGSIMFTIEELKAATHNFSREMIIGSGAYGNVFKGVLKSGVEIAIKVLAIFYTAIRIPLQSLGVCLSIYHSTLIMVGVLLSRCAEIQELLTSRRQGFCARSANDFKRAAPKPGEEIHETSHSLYQQIMQHHKKFVESVPGNSLWSGASFECK